MQLDQYRLRATGWTEVPADAKPHADHSMTWVEVRGFTANEAAKLASRLGLNAQLIESSVSANTSFVATDSEALLQLSTRTARLVGDQISYASLLIVVTQSGLTTIESADSGIGAAVRSQWSATACSGRNGPWSLLAMLLDDFADSYLPLVESVEDQVLAMEEHIAEGPLPSDQVATLFRMRRQLIMLQRVLGPVSKLVARLILDPPAINDGESPNFRAALDGFQRLERTVDGLWQVITSVVEMSNLMEQQRQGSASRKLAAWAGIIAVPTATSGVFGMNFNRMPGFNSDYGYLVALAFMTLVSVILFARFRKHGWL